MQESELWQAVLGEIELSISRGNFVTWFKNTQLIRNKDGVLVVGVPNIFVKNQLERKGCWTGNGSDSFRSSFRCLTASERHRADTC